MITTLEKKTLESGVRIFYNSKNSLKNRVLISNGSRPITGSAYGFPYQENAFIPNKPWRSINSNQLDMVYCDKEKSDPKMNLSIIKLPDSVIEEVQMLGIPDIRSASDLVSLKKDRPIDYIRTLDKIYQFKSQYSLSNEPMEKLGIIVNESNRQTVTVQDNKFVLGMHIDSWDRSNFHELNMASNRICINLGRNERHFLFVNLTLSRIYSLVKDYYPVNVETEEKWRSKLIVKFFSLFPDYPILKVRIHPFEAYIAPTENIIHDGCTEGNTEMDIDITTRGHFSLSKITYSDEKL